MGDDESDSTTYDIGVEETQIFESPNSSFGNKFNGDDPFEDTARCEDELATQVMDLEGETQLFDLAGETQAVHFDDDIEEMDFADTIENNETQLFNDCDTEEVADTDNEGTEILGVSDEETDDASANHLCKNDKKENESETNCGTSEQHTSGGGSKTFTSIRAASLRASGLAALKKASQESQSPSRLKLSSEPDIEHQRVSFERHDKLIDRPGNGSKSAFGRSTARKLFSDDALDNSTARELFSDDALDNSNNDIALCGLSYVESQEPGDASQANALDFVDNFLKVNIESDEKCYTNKSTGGKSKPVLTAKGTQVFAKSASLISAVDKRSIFYFDDDLEDDGETEFFKRKKEVFFGSGSRKVKSSISSGKGQKVKPSISSGKGRKVGEPRRKNMTGLVSSDSKVVLGVHKSSDKPKKSLGTHIKDLTLRKNLINELDEESTDIPLPSGKDIQGNTEARFDTQMAAEAMEDLCAINTRARNQATRTTRSKSKSKLTDDQPKEVKKLTKSTTKSKVVNKTKNPEKAVNSSEVNKRKGRLSLKRAPETNLDQTSVKKQCIQNVTPVARRTRKSIVKEPNKVETGLTEKINIPTGFHPKGKRSSPKSSSTRLTRSKAAISSKQEKGLPKEKPEPSSSTCTTPLNRATPVKESSPVCMGDEYLKQSWRKSRIRASLIQEVLSLSPVGTSIVSPNKDTRERRDISLIRVVFSRHLDGDIIKQQKKILSRLGASETSSMSDATHFIADDFVRTRNMLEAIALGKPVVTHLWLQSCGEACCHIDEKSFILRDAKKEKEIGFSLPTSLARARQNPLLKGQKVLITPNTKPGTEILSSLVKAVNGVAVERMGRNAVKDAKIPEGLLILSCEEDYAVCVPFLEKGATVYSSELLLNGIVTQRLEYERHRLFMEHVKKTRSTMWVKKDDKYKAVGKVK